jgi:hypothetical protein
VKERRLPDDISQRDANQSAIALPQANKDKTLSLNRQMRISTSSARQDIIDVIIIFITAFRVIGELSASLSRLRARTRRGPVINNNRPRRETARKSGRNERGGNEHSLSARNATNEVARSRCASATGPSPLQFIRQFDASINLSLPPLRQPHPRRRRHRRFCIPVEDPNFRQPARRATPRHPPSPDSLSSAFPAAPSP